MLRYLPLALAMFLNLPEGASAAPPAPPSVDLTHGDLRVSPNRRFLVHADGTPFFYLGDTAWELLHRLNREETEKYLENRREKRFTVIQAVVLAELDGLDTPNAYGEHALIGSDPTKPNEAYFQHVDWVVKKAGEKGLIIGMLPTWGNKVVKGSWEKSAPILFNPENALVYGRFLGSRYKNAPNLIWILGGDRDPMGVVPVWRAMARGLKEGDGGRHLITFHPNGAISSSETLHGEEWLDFNMMQSGHAARELANYKMIAHDYGLTPVKPTFDGEARYEDHPVNWKPEELGWFDEYDVRQAAYWGVFAGGLGHTYGCHPIWQMLAPGRQPAGYARHNWFDVLDLPGASQMKYLRALIESRPFLSRVPDQDLLVDNPESGYDHAQATRGDGYAFIYIPAGKPVKVRMGKVSSATVRPWWYDPRTGGASAEKPVPDSGVREFTPPGGARRGNDWVLVLDDAAKHFAPPAAAGTERTGPERSAVGSAALFPSPLLSPAVHQSGRLLALRCPLELRCSFGAPQASKGIS